MMLLVRWVVHAVILWGVVASARALGLDVSVDDFASAFIAVFVLALANTLVAPIIKLFLLPLNCLTFGLLGFAINVLVLWLVSLLLPGFAINSVLAAVYCCVMITVLGSIVNSQLQRRKED